MKKTNALINGADPFDGSAQKRLIRMGVLDKDGQLNKETMSAFAGIFSALFFDDLCDFYDDTKDLLTICKVFRELYEKKDSRHTFLLLSIQYDRIRKPLPDPVWWLAGNNTAVREFMTLFIEHLERLVADAGLIESATEEVNAK